MVKNLTELSSVKILIYDVSLKQLVLAAAALILFENDDALELEGIYDVLKFLC